MSTALIVRNDAALTASMSQAAAEQKEMALAAGALIGKVTNAEENKAAAEALIKIQEVIRAIEKDRQLIKRPLIDYGKQIDATAAAFVKDLVEDATRIGGMASDFAAIERMRQQAAIAMENERLTALEREREAELAKVKTHEEADEVKQKFSDLVAQTSVPIPAATRAEGQRITEEWEIVVNDVHALYRMHSQCVELRPRLTEIKSLLNTGSKVAGVTATKVVKAGVRLAPQRKAIDV